MIKINSKYINRKSSFVFKNDNPDFVTWFSKTTFVNLLDTQLQSLSSIQFTHERRNTTIEYVYLELRWFILTGDNNE